MYVMYICKHILCLHEYLCACVHECGVWGGGKELRESLVSSKRMRFGRFYEYAFELLFVFH